jgi:anti-sigma factor RsiW
MSGDVLSFTKSVHQRTQELLPWFVTGTLDPEESAAVEQHLLGCADCSAELSSLRVFQTAYASSDPSPDADSALARLRARLDEQAGAPEPTRPRPGIRWPNLNLLGPGPAWIKLALAAQFGVIFALGWEVVQTERTGFEYHTLASASEPARAAGSLVVVFSPDAPQREVARILRRAGARVVDGPTASNGYVLATTRGDLQAALNSLRAEPAVVLAEPLQALSTP